MKQGAMEGGVPCNKVTALCALQQGIMFTLCAIYVDNYFNLLCNYPRIDIVASIALRGTLYYIRPYLLRVTGNNDPMLRVCTVHYHTMPCVCEQCKDESIT